ncbi:MAG: hypothetical protein U0570_11795 [Phycisphaerales bacterium]
MKTTPLFNFCLAATLTCEPVNAGLTRHIDLPPGAFVWPTALSCDGSTLIASNPYLSAGWIWRETSGFVKLPDAVYPRTGGLSRDGSFVVGGAAGLGAFRLHTGSMQMEHPPSNTPDARALAISSDGGIVLYTSDTGTFLWSGFSESRIADVRVQTAHLSDNGAVVGLGNGDWAAVWTPAAGLQRLNMGYMREVFVSSDGIDVLALDEFGRQTYLCLWKITQEGMAAAGARSFAGVMLTGGASPDCSILAVESIGAGAPGWYPATVWTRDQGLGDLLQVFQAQGASLPGLLSLPGLAATSSNNRIFVGRAQFLARDFSVTPSKIWLLDLDRSCPGELTFDAQVDDSDFQVFAAAYDAYECPEGSASGCDADLDGNGFVNDADFTLFADSYDRLLCPE